MTTPRLIFLAVVALLWLTPAPGVAQAPAQPEAGGASVLRVDDVADQIIRVTTRIRHTTVIQLPAHETILDFVVGDSEYWHLSGAANLAFLKPIGERVTTNVALVCESGRIYSFLVTERAAPPPPAWAERKLMPLCFEVSLIARPLGLDPATTPILDARLDDGSRVAICVPPASPSVAITVRRFGQRSFSAAQLVEQGALPANVHHEAERVLHTRRNILVSGGTGSGKTTLLNALIALLPDDERIVAIEDTLELRIDSPNCVRFEARGVPQGAVSIRDLVRHALRHRPDHIVVGEVRGGEAADLLQALNTGHGGSLTTVHANNAESALSRLASCAMQGGGDLPWDVTCRGVVDGIAMVIHMTRREGRRVVEEAAVVNGYDAGTNQWDIQRLDRVTV